MTTCYARGCKAPIKPHLLMCRRHWDMVPFGLKAEIWRTYRNGQEQRSDASPAYLRAAAECRAAVAEAEARAAAIRAECDTMLAEGKAAAPAPPAREQLELFGVPKKDLGIVVNNRFDPEDRKR